MNIIVVSGAMARARTLTLDWRHWALGGFGLLVLFFSFTLLFNYVTLRYAASINHPLLQAILLDDQRQQAVRAEEVVQGHLNAMAVKLGELQAQLLRIWQHWQFVHRQILDLEAEQRRRIRCADTPQVEMVRRLLQLKGIGRNGAWTLVMELFGWRRDFNRKQLGSLVGLTPTPYDSGNSRREQGISKAGNKRLRRLLTELAWCWVRHQPDSALTGWFYRRFGQGSRMRRIGIIAVARKLLIALWRYLEDGEVPPGAKLVDWQSKINGKARSKQSVATASPSA